MVGEGELMHTSSTIYRGIKLEELNLNVQRPSGTAADTFHLSQTEVGYPVLLGVK